MRWQLELIVIYTSSVSLEIIHVIEIKLNFIYSIFTEHICI